MVFFWFWHASVRQESPAHWMARLGFSAVLYLASLSDSFRLMYNTGPSTPCNTFIIESILYSSITVWHEGPSPLSDALVCQGKGREKLRAWRSGSPLRVCFTFSNADWQQRSKHSTWHITIVFSSIYFYLSPARRHSVGVYHGVCACMNGHIFRLTGRHHPAFWSLLIWRVCKIKTR